jgi:hypothetical protein
MASGPLDEGSSMYSWIFRHRARLRALYGPAQQHLEPVGKSAEMEDDAESEKPGKPRLAPGTVVRRDRWVLVAPMPRRVG